MTRKKVSEGRNNLSGKVILSTLDGSFTSIEQEEDMKKKQDVGQETGHKTERLSGRIQALVNPPGYLNVSERKKVFRVEATSISYEEDCLDEILHPMFYNFKEGKLVSDKRNRPNGYWSARDGNEDRYDPITSPAIYGARKDADSVFDRIICAEPGEEELLIGCCLIGRTPDGLEAVEREWMDDETCKSYNIVRLRTDIYELLEHLGQKSLDDLMREYREQFISFRLALSNFDANTIGGVLEIFERRRIFSVEELRQEAAMNKYSDELRKSKS